MTNDKTCNNYLNLLQLSQKAWETGDDKQAKTVRQDLLDHLQRRYDLTEEDIAHLR